MPKIASAAVLALLLVAPRSAGGADDCRAHPLFAPLAGYEGCCEVHAFDGAEFTIFKEPKRVEGQYFHCDYSVVEGGKPKSAPEVLRSYKMAARAAGGLVTNDTSDTTDFKLTKNAREVWTHVTGGGDTYTVWTIVVASLEPLVTAQDMLAALESEGHVALSIRFDTGKATLKPQSQPTLDEIVSLLKGEAELELSIEGHTEAGGNPAASKALSEARARAVRLAVTKAGIAPARVWAVGIGAERPIADNDTDEGRAKNSRIELVKRQAPAPPEGAPPEG